MTLKYVNDLNQRFIMKVIVFGGDGFCGWPTALKLSKSKHEVLIIDNLLRRTIDRELGVLPLTLAERKISTGTT